MGDGSTRQHEEHEQRDVSTTFTSLARHRAAAAAHPENAETWHQLGIQAARDGYLREAETAFWTAIRVSNAQPARAQVWANLASVVTSDGRCREALPLFERALGIDPGSTATLSGYAAALEVAGRPGDAIFALRQSLAIQGDQPDVLERLGKLLATLNRGGEAAVAFRRAADLRPSSANALRGLARALAAQGHLPDAVGVLRDVVARPDAAPGDYSDLVLYLQCEARATPEQRLQVAVEYGRRFATPRGSLAWRHASARSAEPSRRVLRVGYVSADFADRPIGQLLSVPLEHHDRGRFAVTCYSDVTDPDALTRQLRGRADRWRDVSRLTHEQLAEQIADDAIDVLVDCTGHFEQSRLPAIAYKPASIVISGFGHPGTTGVLAVDYRLTDVHTDPPGMTEAHYTERLMRLPDCAWCYGRGSDADPGPCPSMTTGYVTFANLNEPIKTTNEVARAWAAILKHLPSARLLTVAPVGSEREICDRFIRHGASPEQLRCVPSVGHADRLARYREIDVVLDAWPYNGDFSTCDALWMGVPVVSLIGDSYVGRRGLSHLTQSGLADLAVSSVEEYVTRAVTLAQDETRRRALRRDLRHQFGRTPLGDGQAFTRHLESAFHFAWTNRAMA